MARSWTRLGDVLRVGKIGDLTYENRGYINIKDLFYLKMLKCVNQKIS